MGSCSVTLTGQLVVGGPGCGGCDTGGSQSMKGLGFACSALYYQAVKSTECAQALQTAGAVGDEFEDLPVELEAYHLLYLKSTAPIVARIGAAPAELTGVGGVFPANLDTQAFAFTIDAVPVAFAFVGNGLTAAQVALQINQQALADGLNRVIASVVGGQLVLTGEATGAAAKIEITTGIAAIGFATGASASGEGADVPVNGLLLMQFNQQDAPERIQVSGTAQIEVLVAGIPSA